MAGGPILPASIYLGAGSGNLYPFFYAPATNTNNAGYLEGVGVSTGLATTGTSVAATLQFNMPESIPSGTLKCRCLSMSTAATGNSLVTLSDGVTSVGSNIGGTTLTSDTQFTATRASADVLNENKVTLASAPTANQILTILVTFNSSGGWTLGATSVWQFSVVWE